MFTTDPRGVVTRLKTIAHGQAPQATKEAESGKPTDSVPGGPESDPIGNRNQSAQGSNTLRLAYSLAMPRIGLTRTQDQEERRVCMRTATHRANAMKLDQRTRALSTANGRRMAVAGLKVAFAACGRADGAELAIGLLEEHDERIGTTDVGPFLLWVPLVGRGRVRRLLSRERISVWTACGSLTPRQRQVVVEFLQAHAKGCGR